MSLTRSTGAAPSGRVWVYGIASGYHHLAFGLRSESAYGAGAAYDFRPGWVSASVSGDLRRINEDFKGGQTLEAWALRLHESISRTWTVGTGDAARHFVFAESFEIIPAFGHEDALQWRALISIALPITPKLSLPIVYGSDYMQNAPDNFKPRYWKSTLGLTYTFGSL